MLNVKSYLDHVDRLVSKARNLEPNVANKQAQLKITDAGIIMESLLSEERTIKFENIAPPTHDNIVEYLEDLLNDVKNVAKIIKNDAINDTDNLTSVEQNNENTYTRFSCVLASLKLIEAAGFIKAYFEEIKRQQDEVDDYKKILKEAKTAVLIINEDMNHKHLTHVFQTLWEDLHDKQIHVHEDFKPQLVEQFPSATNIFYDSVNCDECLKKFDIGSTLFYTIGFKRDQKLPVDIDPEAFVVGI